MVMMVTEVLGSIEEDTINAMDLQVNQEFHNIFVVDYKWLLYFLTNIFVVGLTIEGSILYCDRNRSGITPASHIGHTMYY